MIPILSIIYWAVEFKTVSDGFFASWFLIYPLMNILTIFPIYTIILGIIKKKKADMKKEDDREAKRLERLEEEELDEDELLKDGGLGSNGYGDILR